MPGVRRAFLDRSPGEARAVVTLDDAPERLLIAWEDDPEPRLGQTLAARVEAVSGRMGLARLDLGEGLVATLRVKAKLPPVGERLLVEVIAECAGGKPALVRRADRAEPSPPPSIEADLARLGFAGWTEGEEAREVADVAQAQALASEHRLPGGVTLTIEPTRALVAVDVDLAEDGETVSPTRANRQALVETARLTRLKALGGLLAIDFAGFPTDGGELVALARDVFGDDGADAAVGVVSRFGVLELALPRRRQPLHERLRDAAGRPSPRACAHALLRALERQGRFDPGARLEGVCAPEVEAAARPFVSRLGPRYALRADPGVSRSRPDIRAL